ncbi:hypothetical protein M8C21_020690 [Ambrosia artemisiifolia]|uniref:tRNA-intron lyase n=1 Tax=Ambrosia artemisiifolia TaxID=4212 RepID=A0AAD5G9M9_AMBAR|nr:hypothetical protein M8C21_020690 [Ambrosia artemisiifolia]
MKKMKPQDLEVLPKQLNFIYEPKKQSSCSVQIVNRSDHHVAFEIKTANSENYCVQPNTGVIDPNSTCEFLVTMQAQKVAPLDMTCRDTFLLQSTVVPAGTKQEDVASNTFAKEHGRVVEEKMLDVIIIPPTSKLVQNNEDRVLKGDLLQKNSFHAKILMGPRWKGKGSEVKALANPISKSIAGGDHGIKTDNELWEYMSSRKASFPNFFAAYSHLRVKNWVVRSGCQYGVDFVAYRHHPSLVHSEYGVLVLSQGNGNDRLRVWSDIQCTLRLCGSVAKTLLILHVNKKDENMVIVWKSIQSQDGVQSAAGS